MEQKLKLTPHIEKRTLHSLSQRQLNLQMSYIPIASNAEKKSIDLKGSVAPIKLISRIISVVPAIGELLTGLKKDKDFEKIDCEDNPIKTHFELAKSIDIQGLSLIHI